MNKKFILATLVTTVVLFLLNAIFYAAILKDFFHDHPAVSTEFANQLYKPDDQIIIWAVVLCSVSIGLLLTLVMNWAGARSFVAGIKKGFLFASLFLFTVDFGLLASTNNFTTAGAFADIICSTTALTISCGISAWMLGREKTTGA